MVAARERARAVADRAGRERALEQRDDAGDDEGGVGRGA